SCFSLGRSLSLSFSARSSSSFARLLSFSRSPLYFSASSLDLIFSRISEVSFNSLIESFMYASGLSLQPLTRKTSARAEKLTITFFIANPHSEKKEPWAFAGCCSVQTLAARRQLPRVRCQMSPARSGAAVPSQQRNATESVLQIRHH